MPEPPCRGFPLLPLGIVALPSESVPLHIFEDRYRRMIEQCLKAELESPELEFGIVWLSGEELKPVGCPCEIERVLERLEDGRLNILARGTRPFRVVEFGADAKQELLELRSENARLRLLALLIRAAIRASGAGRARPGTRALQREGHVRIVPAAGAYNDGYTCFAGSGHSGRWQTCWASSLRQVADLLGGL